MHITHSEFVLGAVSSKQFPVDPFPEVAFVGRSNVGKSSLLNRLLVRKKLARVSQTPGCTREINFFRVNQRWWFVDLPGYGFAQVGRDQHGVWQRAITPYLSERPLLRVVVVLLDPRRGLTDLDEQMLDFLESHAAPYLPVATKMDKLNATEGRKALALITQQVAKRERMAAGPVMACSSLTGAGMDALRDKLGAILEQEPAAG
ncbi:MAG: YihA family ribosome biogenesis GTP-binding protein [Magnetococcales bacterium]|nr:YihA family ribosome biogenesis GTP-binding protein [Magnetococcales bacterium]